jgi:hypothetical protein
VAYWVGAITGPDSYDNHEVNVRCHNLWRKYTPIGGINLVLALAISGR